MRTAPYIFFWLSLVPAVAPADTPGPTYVGVTFAAKELNIAAEIAGVLEAVHVRLGDAVEAGAELAKLRDGPVRRELAMVQASLDAAAAERDQRAIELEQAQRRLDRRQELKEMLSEEELAELVSKRDATKAAWAAAEALVKERAARVDSLNDDLSRTHLRAPFAGTVSACHLQAGAIVDVGTPVVRILSEDMWVRFAVPPEIGLHLEVEREVSVRCEGTSSDLVATIRHIAPEVDPMADMIFVEAQLEAPASASLSAGMEARVQLVESGDP